MNNSRGPRSRMGAPLPNRFQRAGQTGNNYHPHPQHIPPRLMNNMTWQHTVQNMPNIPNMPNMNNYHMNQGDNTMLPYQQHMENYGNYVPAIQSLGMPSPDMMNPNNQHVFHGYLPQNFVLQSPVIHGPISPVENVMVSHPLSISTPPPLQTPMATSPSPLHKPMINLPANSSMVNHMPVVKKPFDKYNSHENIVRCSNCTHENHLAACELFNKDEEIKRLHGEISRLNNELKSLLNQVQHGKFDHSQPAIGILQPHQSQNLDPKLSHLSPEAPEFKPDDHSAVYAPPNADEVPVVSAKVMNEENGTDVQTELDELTIEDNVRTESEDMTEDVTPNETPPEEMTSLNIDHSEFTPEMPEEPLSIETYNVEVNEEQSFSISNNTSDAAVDNITVDVVTEIPQEQSLCQDHVEESEQEEFVECTDSSSQIPESTDDGNHYSSENQIPISVSESEHSLEESNSKPSHISQHFYDQKSSYRFGRERSEGRGFSGSYSRGRGGFRSRHDSCNNDKSQQSMQGNRNQNQQMSSQPPRYQNHGQNFNNRRYKQSDDSQDRKPNHRDSSRDSYSDYGSKERNGQSDYRGKQWDQKGNHKAVNNNYQQPLNWGQNVPNPQGRCNDESYGRDHLTELKTKNISSAPRANERRPYLKQYLVTEMKGDLFSAPEEFSLAHCVAKDFRMGSGIAVKFKSEFKRVAELLDQNVDVGGCAHLKHNDRYIFYLVTKDVSTGKPTMATMQQSLNALKEKCQQFGVSKLAIPHIGCGLDRLIWSQVRSLINEIFSDTGIVIKAYEFNASPHFYKKKKNRSKQTNSLKQKDVISEHSLWFENEFSGYDCLPLLLNENKYHEDLSQSIKVDGENLHDRDNWQCSKKSKKKGRKVDVKTEEKYKTNENETKTYLTQIMDSSVFKYLKKKRKKDQSRNKRKIVCLSKTSLSDVVSKSFVKKQLEERECQRKKCETEICGDELGKKMLLEYTKNIKKSKKKSKREKREKHKIQMKQKEILNLSTIQNFNPKDEEDNNMANKRDIYSSGLPCNVVDKTCFASKKRKRKHIDSEIEDENPFLSIQHNKRKCRRKDYENDDKTHIDIHHMKKNKIKHNLAEKADKKPSVSNKHKENKYKHSVTKTDNLNKEEDFSKHKKKKKTHQKSHSL